MFALKSGDSLLIAINWEHNGSMQVTPVPVPDDILTGVCQREDAPVDTAG